MRLSMMRVLFVGTVQISTDMLDLIIRHVSDGCLLQVIPYAVTVLGWGITYVVGFFASRLR
jgi:hypothetical protein